MTDLRPDIDHGTLTLAQYKKQQRHATPGKYREPRQPIRPSAH